MLAYGPVTCNMATSQACASYYQHSWTAVPSCTAFGLVGLYCLMLAPCLTEHPSQQGSVYALLLHAQHAWWFHCLTGTGSLAGGIWSMHCKGSKIATGSKDCSLVVSSLTPTGAIVVLQTYEQQHAGAVKCVRWSDVHVLASSGNDM